MDSIQKTALKATAKTVIGLTAIAIAIPAVIFLVPIEVLGGIVGIAGLAYATKMIYDVHLAQARIEAGAAEYDKKIDQ